MPIPTQYVDILNDLKTSSEEGLVDWREGHTGTFSVHFNNFSFSIWQYEDQENHEEGIACGLYDDKGAQIDNFAVERGGQQYAALDTLYGLARRKARRIDDALASFRALLRSKGGGK